MSHLANDKSHGWDGLKNELFKKYVIKLKGPFTVLFQKVWTSEQMPHSWKIGLIKLFLEGAFSIFLCSVKAYFIDGGNVQDFCKSNDQ